MKVELLHNGNTQTLLTVAPDRISIKFKDGLTADEEKRIQMFFFKVADDLAGAENTLRGTLSDNWSITMKNGRKTFVKIFRE